MSVYPMERVVGHLLTLRPRHLVEPEQASAGDDDGRAIRRVISYQRVQKAQRTERSGHVVPAEDHEPSISSKEAS